MECYTHKKGIFDVLYPIQPSARKPPTNFFVELPLRFQSDHKSSFCFHLRDIDRRPQALKNDHHQKKESPTYVWKHRLLLVQHYDPKMSLCDGIFSSNYKASLSGFYFVCKPDGAWLQAKLWERKCGLKWRSPGIQTFRYAFLSSSAVALLVNPRTS